MEEFGNETGTESAAGNEEIDYKADVETLPLIVTTRYGRNAGNWSLFQVH